MSFLVAAFCFRQYGGLGPAIFGLFGLNTPAHKKYAGRIGEADRPALRSVSSARMEGR